MNIIKALKTTLKGGLSTTGSSFTVQKFVDSKGVELVTADFDGNFVVVIEQGTKIEIVLCSAITQSGSDDSAVLTVATNGRNLNPQSPWTGSSTGLLFTAGASAIVTNDPYTMSKLAKITNVNTWDLLQTFTVMPKSSAVPVDNDDLVNVAYANALVLGTLTTINVIVPATAGETVSAGELLYFDTTDDEWKLCDADTASTVENVMLAIAQGSGVDGGAIDGGVLMRGMDANQSGMTIGDIMYASNTAGEISSSAGTNNVAVGVAKSTTELYFNPRFNQQLTEDQIDALVGNLTTPSSANKFVTQAGLQKGAEVYGADAEANDTYVITLSPVPASYYTGMVIQFKANTANTGASSLNVNTLGAIAIKKRNDQDTETGDIESGQIVTVVYDGTNFQMQSQVANTPLLVASRRLSIGGAVTVGNTTDETALYTNTLSGGVLSTANAVRIRIFFSDLDIDDTGQTGVFRIKYGSTTLATITVNSASGASNKKGWIEAILIANADVSAQLGKISLLAVDGDNTIDDANSKVYIDNATGTATEDSSGDLTLSVTAQWSTATAGKKITTTHAEVEIIAS